MIESASEVLVVTELLLPLPMTMSNVPEPAIKDAIRVTNRNDVQIIAAVVVTAGLKLAFEIWTDHNHNHRETGEAEVVVVAVDNSSLGDLRHPVPVVFINGLILVVVDAAEEMVVEDVVLALAEEVAVAETIEGSSNNNNDLTLVVGTNKNKFISCRFFLNMIEYR